MLRTPQKGLHDRLPAYRKPRPSDLVQIPQTRTDREDQHLNGQEACPEGVTPLARS